MKIGRGLTLVANGMVLLMIAATVICMIVTNMVSMDQLLSPLATFLVALILGVGCICYMNTRIGGFKEPHERERGVIACLMAAFAVMVYFAANIYYKSGSDVWTIDYTARLLSGEDRPDLDSYIGWLKYYYSLYPNNIVFTVYYSAVLKLNHAFGFWIGEDSILLLVIVNCLISCISSYLIYLVLRRTTNMLIARMGVAISLLYFCFNPFNTWVYSDPFALWIPISIVAVVVLSQSAWKWFAVALLGGLGYSIKPQSVIPIISIACMWVIDFGRKSDRSIGKKVKTFFCALAGVTISMCIIMGCKAFFETEITVDENQTLPMNHWMMMGLNEESVGGGAEAT